MRCHRQGVDLMASFGDHVVFTMQFLQMCDDFKEIMNGDECPKCLQDSRSNAICLREECDWMLFVEPNKLHPATIPWMQSLQERLK